MPGAQAALFSVFQCIAEIGDEVIALEPTYATYPAVIRASGAKLITVKLNHNEKGYYLDLSDIEKAITSKTRAILINSPSNPSGAVFIQEDLNELADLCQERGIWLISDEVYWSLCYENDHASAFTQLHTRENVIVLNSLSKSHAMTGWRIGWIIAPEEIIEAMLFLSQAQYFGVSQFVQMAAIEALRDFKNPRKFKEIFRERRDAFVAELNKSKVLNSNTPQGGMFLLIDIEKTGIDLGVNLAISLHAVNDELRNELVPINKKYNLEKLIKSCRNYPKLSNSRRITWEYVMLKDVNDTSEDAINLIKLIKGIPSKINLIPFNPWPGSLFETSTQKNIDNFAKILMDAGFASPIRKPRGQDIYAACGQLKSNSEKIRKSHINKLVPIHNF